MSNAFTEGQIATEPSASVYEPSVDIQPDIVYVETAETMWAP